MGHYTKLATIAVRFTGLIMFLYGAPMVVFAALAAGVGDPATNRITLLGWSIYVVIGGLLYSLSVPLARLVARDLE